MLLLLARSLQGLTEPSLILRMLSFVFLISFKSNVYTDSYNLLFHDVSINLRLFVALSERTRDAGMRASRYPCYPENANKGGGDADKPLQLLPRESLVTTVLAREHFLLFLSYAHVLDFTLNLWLKSKNSN